MSDTSDQQYLEYVAFLELQAQQLQPAAAAALEERLQYVQSLEDVQGAIEEVQRAVYAEDLDLRPDAPQEAAVAVRAAAERIHRTVRPDMAAFDQTVGRSGHQATRYEDRETIGDRAAWGEDGRVFGPDGQPMHGRYGWVIDDETGLLLFLPENEVIVNVDGAEHRVTRDAAPSFAREQRRQGHAVYVERIHHTTPVAGMPVTGAGLMDLEDGWIVTFTDESGHYQPTAENQYEAMRALEDQGVSFQRPGVDEYGREGYRDATVTITGAGGGAGGRPTSKADELNAAQAANPYIDTGNLDLSAQQFEQTMGNETQARNKDALNREFEATYGERLRREAEGDNPDAPAAAAEVAGPANVADPNLYVYDASRDLYRNEDTYDYVDRDGNLVYHYDGNSYLDAEGNPV